MSLFAFTESPNLITCMFGFEANAADVSVYWRSETFVFILWALLKGKCLEPVGWQSAGEPMPIIHYDENSYGEYSNGFPRFSLFSCYFWKNIYINKSGRHIRGVMKHSKQLVSIRRLFSITITSWMWNRVKNKLSVLLVPPHIPFIF